MYIHIGGSFKHDRDGNLRYVDGECDTWQVNPELLTVWEFYEKVRISRYDVDLVEGIYYLKPSKSLDDGLKQIIGDDTVREVLDVMKGHGEVHIYVDHIPNFAEIVPVSLVLMFPAPGDPLELGGGVCSDAGGGVFSDAGGGVLVMLVEVGSMRMRHFMRKEKLKAAYKHAVPVTEGMNQWDKTGIPPVQPPPARKMPRRPKGKRVLEEWEGHTNMSRKGRQMTYQKCFQKGHNSRKCKAQGPTTAPQPKNTNASEEQVPVEDSQHPTTVTENYDFRIPLSQVVNPTPVNDPMSVQNQNEENTNPATVQQQKNRVQIPTKRQNKKGRRSSASTTTNPPTVAPHATIETPQQPKKRVKTTAKEPPRHRAKSVGNRSNQ
ncbi:hypothetical protein SLEP1_g19688 [Rubroshorea leprosula]|uniref:PB1-like domain-containing protein n=1 Tax=Rubroshorea leprosula TaxID=152421 RepID=A0AAV5JAT9_9ROSI|nr:hypothetical protein SLEP1_g19688 [Rubroshorea leprosula]